MASTHILDLAREQRHTDGSLASALDVDKATICRWRIKGILLPDGSRLRLPYTRIGRRAFIHPEDARAFLDALTAADDDRHNRVPYTPTPRRPQRPSRAQQAEREAAELGI